MDVNFAVLMDNLQAMKSTIYFALAKSGDP